MYLQQGGDEANPLMAMALEQGMTSFVATKMALTGLGTMLLAIRHHCWLGLRGLYALAVLYAALLVYHAILYTIVS
jgi:predicted cobalt transporter CbtA